jgi:hypothetical protein
MFRGLDREVRWESYSAYDARAQLRELNAPFNKTLIDLAPKEAFNEKYEHDPRMRLRVTAEELAIELEEAGAESGEGQAFFKGPEADTRIWDSKPGGGVRVAFSERALERLAGMHPDGTGECPEVFTDCFAVTDVAAGGGDGS